MRKGLVLGAVILGACGGEPPTPTTPTTVASVTPKPPPPQSGAKWFFPTPLTGVKDKIDLGDGSMLLVGDQGRREVVKNQAVTDSQYLIPDTLVGAWRADASQFVFVSDSGDTYVSRDPLGQFVIRKGPETDKVKAEHLCTGKAAAVTQLSDGRLLRTGDNGATWTPIEYTQHKLFGHIVHMDMGHDGSGMIIHVPQRVFVTHDDGATWKPAPPPPLGAARFTDDADGGFFVQGYDRHYSKVQGDAIVPTNETPKLLSSLAVTPADTDDQATDDVDTTHVLAGDRVIEFARKTSGSKSESVRFRSTKLGEKPGKFGPVVPALATRESYDNLVAAWGSNILALRIDGDVDENTPTATIVTSTDGGATWKEGAKLDGDTPVDRESVAVGPKGWAFVPGLCGDFGDTHSCKPAKIRVAGGQTFDDLLFTEEFRPRRFAFDEAHDKVYVIGLTDSGNPTVYESPLSQNRFTPLAKPIKTSYHEHTRIAVTADGTLHVFRIDSDKSVLMIERRDVSGKELPTMWVPKQVEVDSGLSSLAIAGSRGVIMNGDAYGWETADAGASWTRIAANGASSPECSDGGCIANDAQRLGWDLPLQAGSLAQTVAATTTAPADEAEPDDPRENVASAPPRMTIACKASGTGTKVPSVPSFDAVNEARDVFWYLHEENAGKTTLTIGGKTGVRKETLLDTAGATPKDVTRQTAQRSLADGYIAARYSKGPQTIDVELGAFSLETGRVIKTTLPKVPAFHVSSYGFTGEAQLVTGGLLYQSTDSTPAFFIKDSGKIERLPVPPHASLAQAQHIGTAWMLFSTDAHNMAKIAWSNDNGGKWDERAWLVSDVSWPRASLVRGAGHPWISATIKEGALLYSIATPPADELPMPAVVDQKQIDAACDPKAPYTQTALRGTRGGSSVQTSIDFGDKKPATSMSLSQRLTRVTQAGGVCTSGYTFYGDHARATLHRDGNKMFGWVFRSGKDYREQTAFPLTCTVTQ